MTVYAMMAESADIDSAYDMVDFESQIVDGNTGAYKRSSSRGYIGVVNAGSDTVNYAIKNLINGPVTEFWCHVAVCPSIGSAERGLISFFSGATPLFKLGIGSSTTRLAFYIHDGTSWVKIQEVIPPDPVANNVSVVDLHVKIGNPGTVEMYVGQATGSYIPIKYITETALNLTWAGITSVDSIRLHGAGSNTSYKSQYSEFMVADWCTLGAIMKTLTPNASGAYTEFDTGTYVSTDEIAWDGAMCTSATANQRLSYGLSDLTALTAGQSIEALSVGTIARYDPAGGPTKLNNFVRISGTDYHQADKALPSTLGPVGNQLDVSPATGVAWTVAEINAMEAGFRSRA